MSRFSSPEDSDIDVENYEIQSNSIWSYEGEHDLEPDPLNDGPISEELNYISKSRLKTKAKCSRKFGYVYVSGVRPPTNFYMERGTDVHDTFERYYENLKAFVAANRTVPKRLSWMLGSSDDWFQFIDWVIPFLDWEKERFTLSLEQADGTSTALELWLPHSMEKDLWIEDPPVGDLPWRGPYDALVKSATVPSLDVDTGYCVVDYKTGSTPDKEYRDKGIHIDLEFYSWMLEIKGFNVTGAIGMYPTGESHVIREMPNPDTRGKIVQLVTDLHQDDVSTEDLQISPSPLCSWCEFQDQCPTPQNKDKSVFQ